MSDGFQMAWVYARGVTAQVVDDQLVRDRSDPPLIRPTVSVEGGVFASSPWSGLRNADGAISVGGSSTCPVPTSAVAKSLVRQRDLAKTLTMWG
jgi:hypothetical protein